MKGKAFALIPTGHSIEIKPLVMCCDCKHYDQKYHCVKIGLLVPDSRKWFCAEGESDDLLVLETEKEMGV